MVVLIGFADGCAHVFNARGCAHGIVLMVVLMRELVVSAHGCAHVCSVVAVVVAVVAVVVVPVVVVVSGGGKVAEILCCVAPEV
jgi:hypothetical protein